MFNLNHLHSAFNLSNKDLPNQWRGTAKDALLNTANLQVLRGRTGGTFATEVGVFGYAAWVSPVFYLIVLEAFAAAARGDGNKAVEIAQSAAKVRDFLREFHDDVTNAIDKAMARGKLSKHHGYVHVFNLVCKVAYGVNQCLLYSESIYYFYPCNKSLSRNCIQQAKL